MLHQGACCSCRQIVAQLQRSHNLQFGARPFPLLIPILNCGGHFWASRRIASVARSSPAANTQHETSCGRNARLAVRIATICSIDWTAYKKPRRAADCLRVFCGPQVGAQLEQLEFLASSQLFEQRQTGHTLSFEQREQGEKAQSQPVWPVRPDRQTAR